MKTVMRMNGFMTKNELRSVMRVRNRQLSPEERIAAAERIFAAVEMSSCVRSGAVRGVFLCIARRAADRSGFTALERRATDCRAASRRRCDAVLRLSSFGVNVRCVRYRGAGRRGLPCVSARGNRFDACARNGIYARRCSAGPRQRLLRSLYGTARVAGFPRRGLFCSPVGRDVADGAARLCDRRGLFRIIARLQRVVLAVQNLLCLAVIKYISVSLLFVLSYILLIFSCLRILRGGIFAMKKVLQSLAV